MILTPDDVLSRFKDCNAGSSQGGTYKSNFGFNRSGKLEDVDAFFEAARRHSLPQLGVSVSIDEFSRMHSDMSDHVQKNADSEVKEFMNSKKAHEVQVMSKLVARLAKHCQVKQVIDIGSGKGYLSSHISMHHGLQVFGIDSSSTVTHGAHERNRKLKKYRPTLRKPKAQDLQMKDLLQKDQEREVECIDSRQEEAEMDQASEGMNGQVKSEIQDDYINDHTGNDLINSSSKPEECPADEERDNILNPFLNLLSWDAVETHMARISPSQLSHVERERRRIENLERKAMNKKNATNSDLFLPVTSYVTVEMDLREVIPELEDAVMIGLHTCGDLAPNMLRMFVRGPEIHALCNVGCCYHLLSEEFDQNNASPTGTQSFQEITKDICGFPMSQYLKDKSCFCGRNARMSACLALERVTHGGGLPVDSLFYRAILHVILQDHYDAHKSEKRVGNVYSKAASFVDYVRRALRRLELNDKKLSDEAIQQYHDKFKTRMCEMLAFNKLKVILAPCIEGLILLDRLCYLKEQENVSSAALVQLFDPLVSPRCYGLVALKS